MDDRAIFALVDETRTREFELQAKAMVPQAGLKAAIAKELDAPA